MNKCICCGEKFSVDGWGNNDDTCSTCLANKRQEKYRKEYAAGLSIQRENSYGYGSLFYFIEPHEISKLVNMIADEVVRRLKQ